jgi:mRNA-degrading endonuclease YafQ of YafQ-DinJ toxin-antitoxin module
MTYSLVYPHSYLKRARRFLKRHPDLRGQYRKTLQLLELDPRHPSLRLHALRGRLSGLSSVSINIAYRIVIVLEIRDREILLVDVGKHDEVY